MSTSTFPAVERIGDRWPLGDYSILATDDSVRPEEVVFEPSIGGRVYERLGHYEEAVSG